MVLVKMNVELVLFNSTETPIIIICIKKCTNVDKNIKKNIYQTLIPPRYKKRNAQSACQIMT